MGALLVFLPLIESFLLAVCTKLQKFRNTAHLACIISSIMVISSFTLLVRQIATPSSTISYLWSLGEICNKPMMLGILFDSLSTVLILVISTINCVCHFYSSSYITKKRNKFLIFLSLLTFSAIFFTVSVSTIQLYIGLELLTISTYFLICFKQDITDITKMAITVFSRNKIADLLFLIAIILLFLNANTFDLREIYSIYSSANQSVETSFYISILLILACVFIKSAQFFNMNWLTNTMIAPTPAAALIHSSTLVTSGVFLLLRLSPILKYSILAQYSLIILGLITAIFGAVQAMKQNNIKHVLSYSTSSQIGLMLLACGLNAYDACITLLITHAFCKALLFLVAGAVIYALSGEHDIRRMGGLLSLMPKTYMAFWIAAIATSGIPPFSAYYSKDILIQNLLLNTTFVSNILFFGIMLYTMLTNFCIIRIIYAVFHSDIKVDEKSLGYVEENNQSILIPMFLLCLIALASGCIFYYIINNMLFWKGLFLICENHHHSTIAYIIPVISIISIVLSFIICKKYGIDMIKVSDFNGTLIKNIIPRKESYQNFANSFTLNVSSTYLNKFNKLFFKIAKLIQKQKLFVFSILISLLFIFYIFLELIK